MFCGIGERCREGNELYHDMKEAGVLENMVMVFGQMNEPPGARFRVGHAALTMAEYFGMKKTGMYCYSLIIFSALSRQAWRFPV